MVLPGFPGKVKNVKRISKYGHLIMRFQQWGCKNRPFYHIVVDKVKLAYIFYWKFHQLLLFQETVPNRRQIGYVEQVGTYDMMTNSNNEKLIALNLERIQTYIAGGVQVSMHFTVIRSFKFVFVHVFYFNPRRLRISCNF